MKTRIFMPLIAAALLAVTVTPPSAQQGPGADQQEKGSTGWSGPQKDQSSQTGASGQSNAPSTTGQSPADQAAQDARDAQLAKTMPVMASGVDLKGPPEQFAPRKTPE